MPETAGKITLGECLDGLLNPAFDKPIVFYFEKFKKND